MFGTAMFRSGFAGRCGFGGQSSGQPERHRRGRSATTANDTIRRGIEAVIQGRKTMKFGSSLFAVFVGACLFSAPVFAQSAGTRHAQQDADAALASMQLQNDPFAPVYVVMSGNSYGSMHDLADRGLVNNVTTSVDGVGTALVVSEIKANMLSQISERIHQREHRCGGFFAFATRAEADAFIRSDRSAQAINSRALLAAYTIDNQATVNPWLSQVQHPNIYSTINTLSSYQNRYYTSPTGKTSAEWIRTTWQGLAGSRTDVTSELFACSTCSTQPSVILTIRGNELPNEIVVLGAHLDSINGSAGGSTTQVAPGADDDASGVATLTEVLRIAMASGWKPKRTVKFMGYAGEEVGLRGSNAIAQSYKTAAANVVAVMQLDMTNYRSGSVADMRLVTDYSNVDMKTFLTNLFDTYLAPLGLTRGTYTCGYGCSDHASWTSAGYPSAMFFEAGTGGTSGSSYNPYIHTANDTLANMANSAQNSAKFAQLGLAFLGEAAKTNGVVGNAAPVANFTSSTSGLTASFTDTSTDSDGTIASRSWTFGDGATSMLANPSRTYAASGTYTVTLTVTDNGGATNSVSKTVTVGSSGVQTYTNTTDYAINDNATVSSPIVVTGRTGNASATTPVAVNIVHTYKGDLKVDLVAPDGSVYVLHNRTGGSADNIVQTYSVNLSAEVLNGTWNLRVNDNAGGDIGRIDSWSITF
jgi:bacterial leucyl aminopeptidase